MPTVGILSSIDYNQHMSDSFNAGYQSVTAALPTFNTHEVDIGYDHLAKAVTDLNGHVDLIVTFGGIIAYNAAIAGATVNFISLIGGKPPAGNWTEPPTGFFKGCCDLLSYSTDVDRVNWLVKTIPTVAGNVGLLYNSHSNMGPTEAKNFTGGQTVNATNGWNDPTAFDQDFDQFDDDIRAVVISADPYFHRNKDQLVGAANDADRYICYPLLSYEDAGPSDDWEVIGPDLHKKNSTSAAYYRMGVMAAHVIAGTALNPAHENLPQVYHPKPK
jgi:hypothetical protein